MDTFDKYINNDEFLDFSDTFSGNAFALDTSKKIQNSTFNVQLTYAQLQYVLSLLHKDYHIHNDSIDVDSFQYKLFNAFMSSLLYSYADILKGVDNDSK